MKLGFLNGQENNLLVQLRVLFNLSFEGSLELCALFNLRLEQFFPFVAFVMGLG